MPGEKIGAVVITNMDNSSEVCWHVAITALRLMLAARQGKPLPSLLTPSDIPADTRRKLAGRYQQRCECDRNLNGIKNCSLSRCKVGLEANCESEPMARS
jgi:hypothetical protein